MSRPNIVNTANASVQKYYSSPRNEAHYNISHVKLC